MTNLSLGLSTFKTVEALQAGWRGPLDRNKLWLLRMGTSVPKEIEVTSEADPENENHVLIRPRRPPDADFPVTSITPTIFKKVIYSSIKHNVLLHKIFWNTYKS